MALYLYRLAASINSTSSAEAAATVPPLLPPLAAPLQVLTSELSFAVDPHNATDAALASMNSPQLQNVLSLISLWTGTPGLCI